LLLTAASILALCAGCALAAEAVRPLPAGKARSFNIAKAAHVLWNQNSNYSGRAVTSMNLTSTTGSSDNDQAADDFVVPKGKAWKVTEVDVTGVYYEGSGPATSEDVMFYKDANGVPGMAIAKGTFNGLHGVGSGGDFAIILPKGGVRLKAGHYWVSVVANVFQITQGSWGWEINGTQHGDQAMWRNPGGGFDLCEKWCTLESLGLPGPDLMFELKGVANAK
jgi:hypothetical protein